MKNLTLIALSFTTGIAFSASSVAQTMSKDVHNNTESRITAEYKADKDNCDRFSGNEKDICIEEAKAKEKVAKAELNARNQNTAKAQYDLRIAQADAAYAVAKEKCDDKAGNAKDVCLKQATAAETNAKADAKTFLKTSEANKSLNTGVHEERMKADEKVTDVRHDAAKDKRDARYAVAKEKCDAYSGDAKDSCINQAKTRYGK